MTPDELKAAVSAEPTVAKRVVKLLTTVADHLEHANAVGELEQELAVLRANAQGIADALEPPKATPSPEQQMRQPPAKPQPQAQKKPHPHAVDEDEDDHHSRNHKRKR